MILNVTISIRLTFAFQYHWLSSLQTRLFSWSKRRDNNFWAKIESMESASRSQNTVAFMFVVVVHRKTTQRECCILICWWGSVILRQRKLTKRVTRYDKFFSHDWGTSQWLKFLSLLILGRVEATDTGMPGCGKVLQWTSSCSENPCNSIRVEVEEDAQSMSSWFFKWTCYIFTSVHILYA